MADKLIGTYYTYDNNKGSGKNGFDGNIVNTSRLETYGTHKQISFYITDSGELKRVDGNDQRHTFKKAQEPGSDTAIWRCEDCGFMFSYKTYGSSSNQATLMLPAEQVMLSASDWCFNDTEHWKNKITRVNTLERSDLTINDVSGTRKKHNLQNVDYYTQVCDTCNYIITYSGSGSPRENLIARAKYWRELAKKDSTLTVPASNNYMPDLLYNDYCAGHPEGKRIWGSTYTGNSPLGQHTAWCAMFVSACSYGAKTIEYYPYCSKCVAGFKAAGTKYGIFYEKLEGNTNYKFANNYQPKAGDLLIFNWRKGGNGDHIGIITETVPNPISGLYKDGWVTTIEGNTTKGSNDEVRTVYEKNRNIYGINKDTPNASSYGSWYYVYGVVTPVNEGTFIWPGTDNGTDGDNPGGSMSSSFTPRIIANTVGLAQDQSKTVVNTKNAQYLKASADSLVDGVRAWVTVGPAGAATDSKYGFASSYNTGQKYTYTYNYYIDDKKQSSSGSTTLTVGGKTYTLADKNTWYKDRACTKIWSKNETQKKYWSSIQEELSAVSQYPNELITSNTKDYYNDLILYTKYNSSDNADGNYTITLPNVSSKKGYTIRWWKTNQGVTAPGQEYKKGDTYNLSISNLSVNFYAYYIPKNYIVTVSDKMYSETSPNESYGSVLRSTLGSTGENSDLTNFTIKYNEKMPVMKKYPTNKGYDFKYYRLVKTKSPLAPFEYADTATKQHYYPKDSSDSGKHGDTWDADGGEKCTLVGIWEPKLFHIWAKLPTAPAGSPTKPQWNTLNPGWRDSARTNQKVKNIRYGEKYTNVPSTPTWEGYIFDGWYDQEEGGNLIDVNKIYLDTENEVYMYAHFLPGTIVNLHSIPYHGTEADGGKFPDGSTVKTIALIRDSKNDSGKYNYSLLTGENFCRKNNHILEGFYTWSSTGETCIYDWEAWNSVYKNVPSTDGGITYWDSDGLWQYKATTTLDLYAKWRKAKSFVYWDGESTNSGSTASSGSSAGGIGMADPIGGLEPTPTSTKVSYHPIKDGWCYVDTDDGPKWVRIEKWHYCKSVVSSEGIFEDEGRL